MCACRLARAYLDNRRILLAALHKLLIGQPGVLIPVHIPEDLVDTLWLTSAQLAQRSNEANLFGRVLVGGQLDHLPGHLVYGPHNLQHLVIGDETIPVNIVQLERPCAPLQSATRQRP